MPLRTAQEFYEIAIKKNEENHQILEVQANTLAAKILEAVATAAEEGHYYLRIEDLTPMVITIALDKRADVYRRAAYLLRAVGFTITLDINQSVSAARGSYYMYVDWKNVKDESR